MTRPSRRSAFWRPPRGAAPTLLLTLAGVMLLAGQLPAQPSRTDPATLRAQIERRYEALPLRDGVALRPRSATGGVRSVEVAGGTIAIDGQPVTGAELRARLGADADLVLQLSYLDDAQRRALFGTPVAPAPAAAPTQPAPSAAPAAPDIPPPPAPPRPARERRGGDRVRFGGSITVAEGESVAGDIVVIGGSAQVDGEVTGDVVVVGGSLRLGPHADVFQDAVVVGGSLSRDPGARVRGEVQEVGVGEINFDRWRFPRGPSRDWWWRGTFGSAFSLVSTLIRVGVLSLLAALVVLFARDYVDRIGARAASEPLKAGAVGLLAQLLFIPLLVVTIVLFVITIVGIPLLILIPFGILAVMVFALVGFTGVATHAGRWISQRFGLMDYGPIATTVFGVLLIASPLLLARLVGLAGGPLWFMSAGLAVVGFCAEYVAWTIGFGAVALSRFSQGHAPSSGAPVPIVEGPTTA
jgi:hypothetical protein